ncbi:unnamed protein product [Closterium sp. NIES-65]|nr:unnamed protein product [Closterium sp. NIES-65]
MSFWGVEVKAGETVVVDPTEHDFDYIHLSQVPPALLAPVPGTTCTARSCPRYHLHCTLLSQVHLFQVRLSQASLGEVAEDHVQVVLKASLGDAAKDHERVVLKASLGEAAKDHGRVVLEASLGEAAKDHERVVLKVRQVEFPEDSDDSDDDDNSDDSNDSDENDDDGKGKAGKGALKSKSFAVGPEVVLGVLMKGRVDFAAMDHIFDRQFSLAHTGSHSVFFSGYKTSDSSVAESLYDDDEEIEEDEEEDEEEDSDEDDDEEEEDEEDEAMEGSDDEEAAAAAMAAEKSSKGMAAAAAAAVEKRARIKSGKKGTPVPSPAGGRGAAALATPAAASKQGTPMAARAEGKDSAPRNGKEVTPKKEPVTGSKRASVSIVTPPSSKGKGEKTERKKPRPDTPAAIKTAAKVKPQAAATVTSPQAQKTARQFSCGAEVTGTLGLGLGDTLPDMRLGFCSLKTCPSPSHRLLRFFTNLKASSVR